MTILTYQYILTPSKTKVKKLSCILENQRQLYNAALQERIECYQKTGKSISLYDQQKSLTQLREDAEFSDIPANIQRWTLKKVDESFKSFFRRLSKSKTKSGFPRFRGLSGWKSFGFNEFSGIRLLGNKLAIKGVGKIKLRMHRPLPECEIKSCTFTYTIKGWKIGLQISITDKVKVEICSAIGVDLGIKDLITLSTGEKISNIHTTKEYADILRRQQRKLSRCRPNSKRRIKVKKVVTRIYHKIGNIRDTYLHQISSQLVNQYDFIAMEDLQISNIVKNHHLAKSIQDVSWGKLTAMMVYKAERAGKYVVLVDPKYTSQTCSRCGHRQKLSLNERIYSCNNCGLVMDRDHNGALNILDKAVVGLETHNVMGYHERVAGIDLEESQIETLP
jgi:putative transposase